MSSQSAVKAVYDSLLQQYGPQHWWPAKTPFATAVGAILTQATRWHNAELALAALRRNDWMQAQTLVRLDLDRLQRCIRAAGFSTQKARRIQGFSRWLVAQGDFAGLERLLQSDLRARLLALSGIGPETADCILLYACKRPAFVVDTYTRRLAFQLGWCDESISYVQLQQLFVQALPVDINLYNEYHALIVVHGKKKNPRLLAAVAEYSQ